MKIITYTLAGALLLTGCQADGSSESSNNPEENNSVNTQEENQLEENEELEEEKESVAVHNTEEFENQLIAIEDLVNIIDGNYEYDSLDKTLNMQAAGRTFYMVENVPVLEINGQYQPYDDILLTFVDDEPYVTPAFIEKGLEKEVSIEDNQAMFTWGENEDLQEINNDTELQEMSPEDMIDFLSFLERPIEGASVSTVESHLPGAPRDYRNGEHEGIDYYDYSSGVEITTETPIFGMGEGEVVRVDHDFEDYASHEERNEELALAEEVGFTPEYILDRLRGQQVWIQYDKGIMIRFAHLDSIPEEIELGQQVDEETVIGYVGNTGTSGALDGDDSGLHLHKDLLVNGELFWDPFTLEETAPILQELWP
ncbi:M23 family metallopeptidase [Alkalicoccus halolimnae]|uniref:M23 family metallopeptidase n=1 Tax=Alkalicoccus halolimnae TaxID=1667239 RepID=A0A5C7F9P9_9BACI|nr:M23 family metallopeptidase [Alkalicoccus halolimnae]TXF87471.1 M23 family metallopeptidase [Alkalicoccus halolimnae]